MAPNRSGRTSAEAKLSCVRSDKCPTVNRSGLNLSSQEASRNKERKKKVKHMRRAKRLKPRTDEMNTRESWPQQRVLRGELWGPWRSKSPKSNFIVLLQIFSRHVQRQTFPTSVGVIYIAYPSRSSSSDSSVEEKSLTSVVHIQDHLNIFFLSMPVCNIVRLQTRKLEVEHPHLLLVSFSSL